MPGDVLYNTALKDGLDMPLGGDYRHYLPQGMIGSKCTDMTDLVVQF